VSCGVPRGLDNVRTRSKYTPPLGRKARSEATLSSAWFRISEAELRRKRRFGVGECATINWPRKTGLLNSLRNQNARVSCRAETLQGGIISVSSGWFCGHPAEPCWKQFSPRRVHLSELRILL
jgi:hypothetical protein